MGKGGRRKVRKRGERGKGGEGGKEREKGKGGEEERGRVGRAGEGEGEEGRDGGEEGRGGRGTRNRHGMRGRYMSTRPLLHTNLFAVVLLVPTRSLHTRAHVPVISLQPTAHLSRQSSQPQSQSQPQTPQTYERVLPSSPSSPISVDMYFATMTFFRLCYRRDLGNSSIIYHNSYEPLLHIHRVCRRGHCEREEKEGFRRGGKNAKNTQK